jgi:hypothetical protein
MSSWTSPRERWVRLTACDDPACPNRVVAGDGRITKVGAVGVNLGLLLSRGPGKFHEKCLSRSAEWHAGTR